MTIKQLISKISILLFLTLTLVLGGAVYGLMSLNKKLDDAVSESKLNVALINESRAAQIAFQRQVQEWKNILIRGNDYELYQKYIKGFKHQSDEMNKKLEMVKSKLNDEHQFSKDVSELITAHENLNKKYMDVLSTSWQATDMQSGQKVDMQLRGIDRDTSAKMDKLAEDIQSNANTRLKAIDESTESLTKQVQYLLLAISVLGFIFLRVILKSAHKNLMAVIGAEPMDLNKYISSIASGDLTAEITIRQGDKQSMAANMALMQRKVKNMISSVKNNVDELEAIHDQMSSADKNNMDTLINNARKSSRSVRASSDRFQF